MKRLLVIALAVSATAACKKGDPGGGGDDDTGMMADAAPLPAMVTDVSTDITTDTEWTALVKVHKTITVAAGATLTVDAGTVIQFDASAGITVAGTVNVNGVKGNVVTIGPGATNTYWGDWGVATGTLNMTYVEMKGAGFAISGTGKFMARDSEFSHHTHDLLVISGGTTDVQYSWIGEPEGTADSTHCDMHIQGGTPTVTVSHSNLSTSAYGVMFYGGNSVDFTYDNWFSNQTDMDKFAAATGDVSFGYFKAGNPSFSNLTANSMATAMVSDAGPR